MGNLSEHFSNRDFACRCSECRGAIRIHLGLVGALELLSSYFKRVPRIVEAYRCELYAEKHDIPKKNSHRLGKAVHIKFDGIPLNDVFIFARTIPEIGGLGFYPKEGVIHIDTRTLDKKDETRAEWIKENGHIIPMTHELKIKYGLA